jgi:hypothetical protein
LLGNPVWYAECPKCAASRPWQFPLLPKASPQSAPLLQEATHAGHDPLSGSFGPDVDVAVVGVTNEAVTSALQLLVQVVQQNVREQRAEGSALGRSLLRCHDYPIEQDACFEVAPDQAQNRSVLYLACNACHEHVVVNPVEELL